MLTKRDFMNARDMKFTVTTIYPPDKQKFLMGWVQGFAQEHGEKLKGQQYRRRNSSLWTRR